MKWVLAIAVFLFCTLEGRRRRNLLKNRVTLLEELIIMLNNFSIEIRCRSLTLDELLSSENGKFARLVQQKKSEYSDIIAAWAAACEELPKNRERVLLEELGRSLGKSDKSGELSLLEMYIAQFSVLKDEAESGYRKKGEAFAKIGMLCGAAAAVLII